MRDFFIDEKEISDLKLEKYILEELSEPGMNHIGKLINRNPEIKKRLDKIEIENRKILKEYPPERIVPQIISQYNKLSKKENKTGDSILFIKKYLFITAPSLVLMVTIFVSILFINKPGIKNTNQAGIIEKGLVPHLNMYRNKKDGFDLLLNNSLLRENDVVQIAYIAAGRKYGVIVSIDGRGHVNLHFPDSPESSTRLIPTNEVMLQNAYQLDNAPDFEKFIFITSQKPIVIQTVLDIANKAAALKDKDSIILPLPQGLEQNSIIVLKR